MALGKMRVLWFTQKGKMIHLGETLMKEFDIQGESIPPAYNCEKERLVFIGISSGAEAPDLLRRYLREMNKARAQNVAFFMDCPKPTAEMLMQQCTDAGSHVMEDVFYFSPGFSLPFMKKNKEEDVQRFLAWARKCVEEANK